MINTRYLPHIFCNLIDIFNYVHNTLMSSERSYPSLIEYVSIVVGRRSGGLLVPRVTTVVLGGAVRSHFNTDLNAGGVTPVF